MIACGHSSDSTRIAMPGRQWAMNDLTQVRTSIGEYWCTAPGGSRVSAILAAVTVTVVNTTDRPAVVSFLMSGRTALVSPTLAA